MKKVEVSCSMCGGEFFISNPMIDDRYELCFCVFCGEEIEEVDINIEDED